MLAHMQDPREGFADKLGHHLRLAHEAAQQRYALALADTALTPIHAEALTLIAEHPGIKPSQLAGLLRRDRSSITAALHALDRRGLIRREATMRDRRSALLHVTETGRQSAAAVALLAQSHERLLDRIVGQDDKPRLVELLRRVAGALAEGGSPR
jgi:DNA-binding MarR family transcriptional regulator